MAKRLTHKRKGRRGICPNVDTANGVCVFLAWTLRKMIAGELSEGKAKSGAYIASVLLRGFEIAEIETRISELERIAGERHYELSPKT
jgi:hypothetical protein